MTEARTTLVPVLLASTGSLYPGVATFIDADAGAADSFSATASGPDVRGDRGQGARRDCGPGEGRGVDG